MRVPQLSDPVLTPPRGTGRRGRRGCRYPGQVLADARPPLREPEAPTRPGPPRLRREARPRRRAVRQRAGRARPRRTDPRGLLEWRAERRERDAGPFHPWGAARTVPRGPAPASPP